MYMLTKDCNCTPLIGEILCLLQYIYIIKLVSGNFCDVEERDRFGRTPLMYSILGNYPDCVRVLLKHRADPALGNKADALFCVYCMSKKSWPIL